MFGRRRTLKPSQMAGFSSCLTTSLRPIPSKEPMFTGSDTFCEFALSTVITIRTNQFISHDWSDEYCVKILSSIRESMAPNSRILICDQVMNTTLGCPELPAAPPPLPANYGYHTRYSHQRDLTMMAIINGIERTPDMFRDIAMRSGLVMNKIWECRSQVSLVELVRAD
jgi:hypothetical protein